MTSRSFSRPGFLFLAREKNILKKNIKIIWWIDRFVFIFDLSNQNQKQKIMNALNLRFKTKKDILPTQLNNQSWIQWFEQYGGKYVVVNGCIGYSGTKVHRFVAAYMNINGENVIISLSSHCGSQSYGSGLSVNFNYTEDQITCKKCKCK